MARIRISGRFLLLLGLVGCMAFPLFLQMTLEEEPTVFHRALLGRKRARQAPAGPYIPPGMTGVKMTLAQKQGLDRIAAVKAHADKHQREKMQHYAQKYAEEQVSAAMNTKNAETAAQIAEVKEQLISQTTELEGQLADMKGLLDSESARNQELEAEVKMLREELARTNKASYEQNIRAAKAAKAAQLASSRKGRSLLGRKKKPSPIELSQTVIVPMTKGQRRKFEARERFARKASEHQRNKVERYAEKKVAAEHTKHQAVVQQIQQQTNLIKQEKEQQIAEVKAQDAQLQRKVADLEHKLQAVAGTIDPNMVRDNYFAGVRTPQVPGGLMMSGQPMPIPQQPMDPQYVPQQRFINTAVLNVNEDDDSIEVVTGLGNQFLIFSVVFMVMAGVTCGFWIQNCCLICCSGKPKKIAVFATPGKTW